MKNFSTLCGLALLTAIAASGCGSEGFQLVKPKPGTTKSSAAPVSPVSNGAQEDDVILPSGGTSAGGTTGGGATGGSTVEETDSTPPAPVCAPETDADFCARLSKNCDSVTAMDNCGTPRTADCGSCRPGFTCGGETPNVCASVTAPYCYDYAFVSTRDGYENLYKTSTCSQEEPAKVTHNSNEDVRFRNLQISENGQKATYDYIYPGAPDWVMSIDDLATLGNGGLNIAGCRSAALSPDNHRVVYVCDAGLYFVDLDDSTTAHLIASDYSDTRVFEKAAWSPVASETDASHDKVIFSATDASGSGTFSVYDAKTDGRARPLYEQYSGDGHDVILKGSSADISPDGKTMLFVRKSAVTSRDQIWACDLMFDQTFPASNSLSTSSPRVPTETKASLCVSPRLLTSEGSNSAPHWTSNGKHIFFTSDRDGNREIYVMKADGSDEANVTNGNAADRDAAPLPLTRTLGHLPEAGGLGRVEAGL